MRVVLQCDSISNTTYVNESFAIKRCKSITVAEDQAIVGGQRCHFALFVIVV